MNIKFDKCDVIVDSKKILAESASLSEKTDIQPAYVLGNKIVIDKVPVGGFQNSLQINYLMEVNNEPNYTIITGLKESTGIVNPIVINIGGISGSYYLDSYGFSVTPNNLVKVSASYINYNGLSGNFTEQSSSNGYNLLNNSGLAHYWTTTATKILTQDSIKDGMVANWKFDENAGNLIGDEFGNTGYTYNTTWSGGKKSSALEFNGKTSYVNFPHRPELESSNITLMAWVYPSGNLVLNEYGYIIAKGRNFGFSSYKLYRSPSKNFGFYAGWNQANTPANDISYPFPTINTWYHLVGVYDGQSSYLYINGELVSGKITQSNRNIGSLDELNIGSWKGTVARQFSGLIDDVKIYNRALSANEIKNTYLSDVNTYEVTGKAISFDYNFKPSWEPIYVIGNPYPCQVSFVNAEENFEITTETLKHAQFSGEIPNNFFDDINNFKLKNISTMWTGTQNHSLNFSLESGVVTSNRVDLNQDNIFVTKTTINNYY